MEVINLLAYIVLIFALAFFTWVAYDTIKFCIKSLRNDSAVSRADTWVRLFLVSFAITIMWIVVIWTLIT